jgi:hypothetical protein
VLRVVVGGGRCQVLQDLGVSLLTQVSQVTNIHLQLTAVLVQVQERRDDLEEEEEERQLKRGSMGSGVGSE